MRNPHPLNLHPLQYGLGHRVTELNGPCPEHGDMCSQNRIVV